MVIVCGTDFSGPAVEAERAAAALAVRRGEELRLVHVLDFPSAEASLPGTPHRLWTGMGDLMKAETERRRKLLENEAQRIREMGVEVSIEVRAGAPDEALVTVAEELEARLVVVASLGQRTGSIWRLGSVADRLTQTCPVPVLVVRDAHPFEQWAQRERSLRALVGIDFTFTSNPALDWLSELRGVGPCDVVKAHIYDPTEELGRLGSPGPGRADARELLERALARDLIVRSSELAGQGETQLVVRPGSGPTGRNLVELAREREVDLIVVGSHQRSGFGRYWHGSVSYEVLPMAEANVVCVPARSRRRDRGALPRPKRVLCPTDLSELGDRAARHAFSLVGDGGLVTLFHVLEEPTGGAEPYDHAPVVAEARNIDASRRRAGEHLDRLVPSGAQHQGIEWQTRVVPARSVAEAIRAEAERENADLICMATHGRTGLSSVLVGSVAHEVLRRSRRPVLMVGAGTED